MRTQKNEFGIADAVRAAFLLCEKGKTQEEIATALGTRPTTVFRLLRRAEKEKILDRRPRFDRAHVPGALLAQLERQAEGAVHIVEAVQKLMPARSPSPRVHVVEARSPERFLPDAASYVARLIGQGRIIGITGGRSTRYLLAHFQSHRQLPGLKASRRLRFVPLSGDPTFVMNLGRQVHSASQLAADFERLLIGRARDESPSLAGVPAYVAVGDDDRVQAGIERFVRSIPGYRAIFGPPNRTLANGAVQPPLISEVEMVLTGVGGLGDGKATTDNVGEFILERLRQIDAQTPSGTAQRTLAEDLPNWIHGDIAGHLLPKPGLSDDVKKRVNDLNRGWMGITQGHLRAITKRAYEDESRPGVVVVAFSPWKACAVAEAIRLGLTHHLVISHALGERLTKIAAEVRD